MDFSQKKRLHGNNIFLLISSLMSIFDINKYILLIRINVKVS